MRTIIAAAFVTLAGAAHAQTVIDGSDAGVPKDMLQEAARLIGKDLLDPGAMQFRALRTKEFPQGVTALCGEMNGKNAYGAYIGFLPFIYAPKTDSPIISASNFSDQALRASTSEVVRILCFEKRASQGGS